MLSLNVKKLTLILITALAAVGGWKMGYARVLPQVVVAVAAAAAIDAAVVLFRQKKLVWSDSAAITGLIVAGVAAPQTSPIVIAAVAAVAVVSKHIIRFDRRNVFNPAALGLLLGVFVFGLRLSWWIDSTHLLTIAAGALLLARFAGRWRLVLVFLAVFAGLLAAYAWRLGDPLVDVWFQYVSITSFFVFFMATDPRTSPVMARHLPAFGAIAAAGSFLSVVLHPASIFIGGELLANLFTPLFNRVALRKKPLPAPPVQAAGPVVAGGSGSSGTVA
jgi:Na+-translocating ferredoxin:NAD+ oxidoreductase RnfD subunit